MNRNFSFRSENLRFNELLTRNGLTFLNVLMNGSLMTCSGRLRRLRKSGYRMMRRRTRRMRRWWISRDTLKRAVRWRRSCSVFVFFFAHSFSLFSNPLSLSLSSWLFDWIEGFSKFDTWQENMDEWLLFEKLVYIMLIEVVDTSIIKTKQKLNTQICFLHYNKSLICSI